MSTAFVRTALWKRLAERLPSQRQVVEWSPALVATLGALFKWEWEGVSTIVYAVLLGFAFQVFLMIGLVVATAIATHWLKPPLDVAPLSLSNPQFLGALLLAVTLSTYSGQRAREREHDLIQCLEERAATTRRRIRSGSDYAHDALSLDKGAMGAAVKECRAEFAESQASDSDDE